MTIFDEVRNEMKDDEIKAKREIKENIEKIRSLEFEDMGHVVWQLLSSGVVTVGSDNYDKVGRIIVHCDGGVSRSAGVAAAIMRVKEGDDFLVFDNRNKHPNMTCYLRTLKGFKYI